MLRRGAQCGKIRALPSSGLRRASLFWGGRGSGRLRGLQVTDAKVAELVDALDLGSSGVTRESSSLSFRTRVRANRQLSAATIGSRRLRAITIDLTGDSPN